MTHPATRHPSSRRLQRRGFTLIELMITVAIIAILARVALPAYFDYTKRGKLTEAFNQMSSCSMVLGQYYQDNRSFVGADTSAQTASCIAASTNFTYALPSANLTSTGYLLRATGIGAVAGFTYTLDNTGARATTAVPSGWTLPVAACWANSRSGCQ